MGTIQSTESVSEKSSRCNLRPTLPCNGCGQNMILNWSKIPVRPYFRHADNTSNCKHPICESYTHRLAKRMLVEFLQKGGTIDIASECLSCETECHTNLYLTEGKIAKEEVTHIENNRKARFDVAILSKTVEYGIEIVYSHKTQGTAAENRRNINWAEIYAESILDLLDKEQSPTLISLECLRERFSCEQCSTQLLCQSISQVDSEAIESYAQKLGYLVLFICEIQRVLDEASKGKYDIKRWILYPNTKQDENIWNSFLKRKQCIKCEKVCDTEFKKPFCLSCYRWLIKTKVYTFRKKSPRSNELRSILEPHIAKIPLWSKGISCVECGTGHYEKNFVSWNDEKRAICLKRAEKLLKQLQVL